MKIDEIGVDISDDKQELEILKEQIEILYGDINFYHRKKEISKKKYDEIRDKVEDVLYGIADLSIPVFRISESLRDYYILKYKNDDNSNKGRDLYLERYHKLHEPYDLLKNKCYMLFRKIDKIKRI